MAALSEDARRRIIHAVGDRSVGADIVDKLNAADAGASQDLFPVRNVIVATNVSTTIDFASLAVGDKILILGAAAGNAQFVTCAVAGTLPQAAVVGSLYVVLRAYSAPTASASTL
jgi:hypothetical protein